jgi:hypothetical protein
MAKGFLRSGAAGEGPDPSNEGAELEKTYIRMFPKIGRDFIHRDDLFRILLHLLDILDVDPARFLEVNPIDGALKRALEYKVFLDAGEDSNKIFHDLIILDDEIEDE